MAVWEILRWCLEHDIVLRNRHIPGKFNILADSLSRLDRPLNTEWFLDQSVANSIFQKLNFPNVDLFATQFNHKLPLCIFSSGQSSLGDGRIINELDISTCICISSNNSDTFNSSHNTSISVQNRIVLFGLNVLGSQWCYNY